MLGKSLEDYFVHRTLDRGLYDSAFMKSYTAIEHLLQAQPCSFYFQFAVEHLVRC